MSFGARLWLVAGRCALYQYAVAGRAVLGPFLVWFSNSLMQSYGRESVYRIVFVERGGI